MSTEEQELLPKGVTKKEVIGWFITLFIFFGGLYLAQYIQVYANKSAGDNRELRINQIEKTQSTQTDKIDAILQNTNQLVIDVAVLKETKEDKYHKQ